MPLRGWRAGLLITIGILSSAGQADAVEAVAPGGPGVLTKCRAWLMASSCRTYHHIHLPSRISIGDTIPLSYGSHPKHYRFFVARIALEGDHCAIFSKATGDRQRMDKINVAPCYPAQPAR